MAEQLLEIRGLKTGYGATEVLRGIDMAVHAGEIVTVLGSNGVGKTTLNKVLSGVLPPWSGEIRFGGTRIDGKSAARIVEEGLIQVPEGRKIFPNLSIRENLELGSYRRGKPNRARNLERIFATFPRLKEREGQLAGTLSGGEQQMLPS
ncbi:ABC transporter ATP-binding protein, partial [Azospirillum sp. B506]|uniref:ABC transporter ATP-binding protein n=1 Tax=Azospirillum sp. B506 TaxID=137721 RepID=UPI0005B268CA